MGGCSVRHLELSLQRSLLQVQVGTNTHSSGSPDTVAACLRSCACWLPQSSGPPWRCRRIFSMPAFCQKRGLHAGDATKAKGQTLEDGCVDGRFCCCRCLFEALLLEGVGWGFGGGCKHGVGGRPLCYTDDGRSIWMASGGINGFQGLDFCASAELFGASPADPRAISAAQMAAYMAFGFKLGGVRLLQFSSWRNGLFWLSKISDRYHQLIRLNRPLVMCFLKPAVMARCRSTSPA